MDFFRGKFAPPPGGKKMARFGLYTLKDPAEQDDNCANVYNKSLLYLVAHACESKLRVFFGNGTPLLGMEKFILKAQDLFDADADAIRKENPNAVQLPFGPE